VQQPSRGAVDGAGQNCLGLCKGKKAAGCNRATAEAKQRLLRSGKTDLPEQPLRESEKAEAAGGKKKKSQRANCVPGENAFQKAITSKKRQGGEGEVTQRGSLGQQKRWFVFTGTWENWTYFWKVHLLEEESLGGRSTEQGGG